MRFLCSCFRASIRFSKGPTYQEKDKNNSSTVVQKFDKNYVTYYNATKDSYDVINIDEPGDRFIIEFDVVNGGSIDAKLESIAL